MSNSELNKSDLDTTLQRKSFLPYQVKYLKDKAQIKVWRKSRRIGATYLQAFEDVVDALTLKIRGKVCDVWFSSADLTAAKEYINYCAYWAKVLNIAVEDLGEIVIDIDKDVKALSLEFKNGARINALSSNPSQFRSKGGKIVLDEFAHHKDQQRLWTAANASALVWGYPIRILSTDNGVTSKFYKFVKDIMEGRLKDWSLHETPIQKAVEQGLADVVKGRKLSEKERLEYLDFLHQNAGDEITWLQEYCCQAVDEESALLSFEMLEACQQKTFKPIEETTGDLYVGMDVARNNHLSVIAVLEKLDNVSFLRQLITMKKTKWSIQEKILWKILSHQRVRRACIDATGIGDMLAERAQERFGSYRIEKNKFTAAFKEEIAMKLYTTVEDCNIRFENDAELIADLHSMKRMKSKSNTVRIDVDMSETDGHGDRFIAIALANHAARKTKGGKAEGKSGCPRSKFTQKYDDDFEPYRSLVKKFIY